MGIPAFDFANMRGPVPMNDMSVATNTNALNLQMLLAASQCVSSEPENDDYLEQKLDVIGSGSGSRKLPRSRVTPRGSIPASPNTSGTVTPTEDAHSVEQWLERRKKQQSQAQSRYRQRQKVKQNDLLQELDRLRALAAQYNINVVDPDAADDDSNGSGQVSDSDVTPSLSGASTPPFGSMMNGNGDVQAGGMVHSWSVSNPPQLSLTPQAIAQRKYRAKLKMKRNRLQRQVDLYSRVLSSHVGPVHMQSAHSSSHAPVKMDYGPLN